jgi:hypothetical protein
MQHQMSDSEDEEKEDIEVFPFVADMKKMPERQLAELEYAFWSNQARIGANCSIFRAFLAGEGFAGPVHRALLRDYTAGTDRTVAVKYVNIESFNVYEIYWLLLFHNFIGVYVRKEGTTNADYNSCDKNPNLSYTDHDVNFLCSVYELQNIPPGYEICIVMKLFSCSMLDLHDDIMRNVNVIDALTQLVEKLLLLHSHGFQHNDIKEGNVLVDVSPTGRVSFQLADLGCAFPYKYNEVERFSDCALTPDDVGMYDLIYAFLKKKSINIPEDIRKDLVLIYDNFNEDGDVYTAENQGILPETFEQLLAWFRQKQKQN